VTEPTPAKDPTGGYVSEASKRRFTIVAGVLGAVFFLTQFAFPFVFMFGMMGSMLAWQELKTADLARSALWQGDLWVVEKSTHFSWQKSGRERVDRRLKRVGLIDLRGTDTGVTVATDEPSLLPAADRLYLVGRTRVSYFEKGRIVELDAKRKYCRTSQPFLFRGNPALITIGCEPELWVLESRGGPATWRAEPFDLDLPTRAGSYLSSLEVLTIGDHLELVAELATPESADRSLYGRELPDGAWFSIVANEQHLWSWQALPVSGRPAVIVAEGSEDGRSHFTLIGLGHDAASAAREISGLSGPNVIGEWRAFSLPEGMAVVAQGFPGNLRLWEVKDGRVARSVRVTGSTGFPFGNGMLLMMVGVQLLPVLLSLLLALILAAEMARHRVVQYVAAGHEAVFASVWRRALAQLVDAVFLCAGSVAGAGYVWRLITDPEAMAEVGPGFVLTVFGLLGVGVAWMIAMLAIFSYIEGRWGKTPGKWLLRIRVLGTDLMPCGFWRALLRNLLTFVDGFFNFLVGILLVALTEHWQRVGDLAARTIVVLDRVEPRG
jgi:uncharacterized RDD family membrane protein YckC